MIQSAQLFGHYLMPPLATSLFHLLNYHATEQQPHTVGNVPRTNFRRNVNDYFFNIALSVMNAALPTLGPYFLIKATIKVPKAIPAVFT